MHTFMTIADFCQNYRVSRTTFYRQSKAGFLPVVKVGRSTRIRLVDAQRWADMLEHSS